MTTSTHVHDVDSVIIRFAGDSGDGMQLTGTQFTNTAAIIGNDISTFPDFPAEIRAPAGTLAGVSGFQVHLSNADIHTPGDEPEVLVAMNPAALKANLKDLKAGGVIIVNSDEFTGVNLKKAGYESNPLEDDSLRSYRLHAIPLTSLNREALAEFEGLSTKEKDRCKNFFSLGLTFWIYDRPLESTIAWAERKFAKKPEVAKANIKSLQTGYYYGETAEAFQMRYRVSAAPLPPGTYRSITGNEATAIGLVTAAKLAEKSLLYASYPITPASDILHHLSRLKEFDVRTFQAEDEIAAMGAVIGGAFGGALAVTGTSGPGIALKSEALNLALVLELPMIVVNVQRGGPSTGLPTKTEQSDLLQVMFGRNGESPLPVIAPCTPADCYNVAVEATRLAIRSMSPVVILSDGYLANSAEPWLIPNADDLEPINVEHPDQAEGFQAYARNPETLARPWALPGTPGLEHRIGGLGKQPVTGNVSYDPKDHQQMVDDRAAKVAKLADVIPPIEVHGDDTGKLLVIGWGGTYGAILQAVNKCRNAGMSVSQIHLRHLNPFPRNLEEVMGNFDEILVPELNMGQLALLLQGRFARKVHSLPKVQGKPFKVSEIVDGIKKVLA